MQEPTHSGVAGGVTRTIVCLFREPDQVISELLKPYDARLMRSYPVTTRINNVANDDEECSRPVEIT